MRAICPPARFPRPSRGDAAGQPCRGGVPPPGDASRPGRRARRQAARLIGRWRTLPPAIPSALRSVVHLSLLLSQTHDWLGPIVTGRSAFLRARRASHAPPPPQPDGLGHRAVERPSWQSILVADGQSFLQDVAGVKARLRARRAPDSACRRSRLSTPFAAAAASRPQRCAGLLTVAMMRQRDKLDLSRPGSRPDLAEGPTVARRAGRRRTGAEASRGS